MAPASAPASPSAYSGTLAIASVTPAATASGLAQVVADALVTPQCDPSDCDWRPVVETVAQGEACVAGGASVWTGAVYSASTSQRISPSWHELPAATPASRRACLFARAGDGQETLVAQADYTVPAASVHGGPDPGLLRTPIPRWVAPVRRRWPLRVSTAGLPPGVAKQRFVALVHAAAVRWGLPYAGTTRRPPLRADGRSTVGFARGLPGGALGLTEIQVLAYRRGGQIVGRHVVEQDTYLRYDAPWAPGPALPDARHVDLETTILHELGHYAGNGRHARNCRDSPMWASLGPGEWWHSPTDWFQHGCG